MEKRNVQFAILQVIGIVFVVLGHRGGTSIFNEIFPIYSFHMPLFFFISGYFFNEDNDRHIIKYIWSRIYKLLLPFYIWNLIYGIIANVFRYAGIIQYGDKINIKSLFIEPLNTGLQYGLNCVSWFVPALVVCQLIFVMLRFILKHLHLYTDVALFFICIALAVCCITLSYQGHRYDTLFFQHFMYGIFYYCVGYLYRKYIEKIDTINSVLYLFLCIMIQYIVIVKTNNNLFIGMWDANYNNFNGNVITALIGPLCGIAFWLRISRILAPSFAGNNKLIFVSENTWTIMMHHQFWFFVINLCFLFMKEKMGLFMSFDNSYFASYQWYAYEPSGQNVFMLFYVFIGICIPLQIKWIVQQHSGKNKIIDYIIKAI